MGLVSGSLGGDLGLCRSTFCTFTGMRTVLKHIGAKEVLFQVVLHMIIFLFYSYDRRHPQVELYEFFFFVNYAVGAFLINYILLPRYLYLNKYMHFFGYLLLVLAIVVIIEEGFLERVYFPDTKGKSFFGGIHNLLDVLPTILILTGFKFAWDALGKQREVEALQGVIRESELQFLKSQINPHFLFNNLNNLYAYAIKNDPKTPDIILQLSDVLRYMLYECKARQVPLSREIEQLTNFISLGMLQIKNRGEVNLIAPPVEGNYQIAPLILIVFIENAFKHSSSSQSDQIRIDISVEVSQAGMLHFKCSNTYQEQSNLDDLSKGIGLENVQARLNLLYPKEHQLSIVKTDEEYTVSLQLDLNQH